MAEAENVGKGLNVPGGMILSGAQAVMGLAQRAKASKRRKIALAKMKSEVPDATKEQVQLMRERASRSGLPGSDVTRARAESNIAQGVDMGEAAAQTSSDVLGLYSKMFGQKQQFNNQLLESGAQYKSQNELDLSKSLGLMANAEQQQFHYNQYVPFLSEMGYAGEQSQGGAANVAAGLQGAYSNWENQWMADQWKDLYSNSNGSQLPSATGQTSFGMQANNYGNIGNTWDNTKPQNSTDLNYNDGKRYGNQYPAF